MLSLQIRPVLGGAFASIGPPVLARGPAIARGGTVHEAAKDRSPPGTSTTASPPAQGDSSGLTQEEQAQVRKLERRDREVRAHEQAHLSAAGSFARGGVNLEFKTGPDGKNYAVGGHVNIDASPVPGDPEATLQKAPLVRAAALAPADPSPQDLRVAAQAARNELRARLELNEKQKEDSDESQSPGEDRAFLKATETYEKNQGSSETDPANLFDLVA